MEREYRVLGAKNVLLGECPNWDSTQNKVRYLDIDGKKLITLDLGSGKYEEKHLAEKTGAFVLCENGGIIYCATSGIFDEQNNLICALPKGRGNRFNDGKATPDGKMLAGSIELSGGAALFRLEKGRLYPVIEGVKISNGLDFSLNEKILYYCDSAKKTIECYTYPEIKHVKTLIDFNDLEGKPDGLCIDCEGNLYVAIWGGSCVVKIDYQSGEILETIDLPIKYVSCPVFVGEKLDTLFVTSAKADDKSEYAGRCFEIKMSVRGREPYKLKKEHIKSEE